MRSRDWSSDVCSSDLYERLRAEADEAEARAEKLQIQLPNGRRLGGVVIEADHVSKGYGDRLLIEDLTFKLPPAGIVGVIGPNGAGKTTLFRMITSEEKPDSGRSEERRVGKECVSTCRSRWSP